MRLILNVILVLITVALIFLLYSSIKEPIAFSKERKMREDVVVAKLSEIRKAQELYRDITGSFAPNFDTLTEVLTNGRFALIAVTGDPDDPNFTGTITYDTTYKSAIDSIRTLGIDLANLRYVPFSEGEVFDIQSDIIDYQSTEVPVVEVGVRRKVFMGGYGDKRFARYDKNYDPNKPLKFGDMNAPNLSGNWE